MNPEIDVFSFLVYGQVTDHVQVLENLNLLRDVNVNPLMAVSVIGNSL